MATRTVEQQNFVVSPKIKDKDIVTKLIIMADADNTTIEKITSNALNEYWNNHYTVSKH